MERSQWLNIGLHAAGVLVLIVLISTVVLTKRVLRNSIAQVEKYQQHSLALLHTEHQLQSNHQTIQQQFLATHAVASRMKNSIPDHPGEIEFMSGLSQLADSTGFRLGDFRPGSSVSHDFHDELEIRFAGAGDYQAICRFLHGLQQMPRCYRLASIGLTAPALADGNYEADFQLRLVHSLNSDLGRQGSKK
jgi:Tfp pilus assembly protein PilO